MTCIDHSGDGEYHLYVTFPAAHASPQRPLLVGHLALPIVLIERWQSSRLLDHFESHSLELYGGLLTVSVSGIIAFFMA